MFIFIIKKTFLIYIFRFLSNNELTNIPDEIFQLEKLEVL